MAQATACADPDSERSGEGSRERGGISHLEFSALEGVEDHETLRSLLRQGQHTPGIRLGRGVTFSLNA